MVQYLLALASLAALFVATFVMADGGVPGAMIVFVDAGILGAFCLTDWLLAPDRGMPTPTRVYAMLIVVVAAGGFVVYVLSLLGPVVLVTTLFVLTVATVVAGFRANRNSREAREAAGLCPECGYDLRATEERCPECNTLVPESILRWRRLGGRPQVDGESSAAAPGDAESVAPSARRGS